MDLSVCRCVWINLNAVRDRLICVLTTTDKPVLTHVWTYLCVKYRWRCSALILLSMPICHDILILNLILFPSHHMTRLDNQFTSCDHLGPPELLLLPFDSYDIMDDWWTLDPSHVGVLLTDDDLSIVLNPVPLSHVLCIYTSIWLLTLVYI